MFPDISAVEKLMREVAATEVLPKFRNLKAGEITEKKYGEVVTIADKRSEAALDAKLRNLLPGSKVIGEEKVSSTPSILDLLSTADPIWIVDPLDGTLNFANGNTCFAMIVAYVLNRHILSGWILEPYSDKLVWAAKGQGAWEKGNQLQITERTDVSNFRGSLGAKARQHLYKRHLEQTTKIPREMTRYRCIGAEYADLARGRLDFARYTGNIKPWDHAAGILIHAEAGGFSAYSDTEKPYVPIAPHIGREIILSPGRMAWIRLRELLSN